MAKHTRQEYDPYTVPPLFRGAENETEAQSANNPPAPEKGPTQLKKERKENTDKYLTGNYN